MVKTGKAPENQPPSVGEASRTGEKISLPKPETPQPGDQSYYFQQEVLPTLAHEMRGLLTSIKGYSSALLIDEIRRDEKTLLEYLKIIDQETDALEQLLTDLLDSSLIDSGRINLEKEPVLLSRLAEKAVKQIGKRACLHKFIINFTPASFIAEADPQWIEQVLFNIIDNAVKYSPEGGLIVIRGEMTPREIIVSVADQGIGLAPEHLNRLFEKFFRVKIAGRKIAGSGLGLPISRAIIQAHRGRIWAESQLGKGTTLYFSLPRPEV